MRRYRSSARICLERRLVGSRTEVNETIRLCDYMRALIHRQFGIRRCEQWRAHHVRWLLAVGLVEASPKLRHRYYLAVKAYAVAMNRWSGWERFLRGPWTSPES